MQVCKRGEEEEKEKEDVQGESIRGSVVVQGIGNKNSTPTQQAILQSERSMYVILRVMSAHEK